MSKFKWVGYSHDYSYEVGGDLFFDTEQECYNDMRNAALEKMKWNTEYNEDFNECEDGVEYHVIFTQKMIAHSSYSGLYVYVILDADAPDKYRHVFTDEVLTYLKGVQMLHSYEESTILSYRKRTTNFNGITWELVDLPVANDAILRQHVPLDESRTCEWWKVMDLPQGKLYMDNVCGQMLVLGKDDAYYTIF